MTVRTNLTLRQMIITHKKYVGDFGGEGGIRPAALGQCREKGRDSKSVIGIGLLALRAAQSGLTRFPGR